MIATGDFATGCTYAFSRVLHGARITFWVDDEGAHAEVDAFEARHAPREFPPLVMQRIEADGLGERGNDLLAVISGAPEDAAKTLNRARGLARTTRPRCYRCGWRKPCEEHAADAAYFDSLDSKDEPLADEQPELEPRHVFTRGDHVDLAAALVKDLGGSRELTADEGDLWRYDESDGTWKTVERDRTSRIVQGYAGESVGFSGKTELKIKASDVVGAVKLAHDRVAKSGFFAAAAAGIVFENGFLRVDDKHGAALEPHTRDHRARAGYRFNYRPQALPLEFLRFLAAVFRDDSDRCEKESFVQEFFGACLLGVAPVYQRTVVAVGGGENGKSRLADILLECMPAGTTSAVAPQEWGQEYRRAMLIGKRLNAVGELPERDILASEAFKAIVSGDPIVARVIRESPVMVRPIAGHYFAANRLPGSADQTEGFWRRFTVLTFNRSFKNDPTRDPHIATRIVEAERPSIVSWLIDGAVRLMRSREYTIPESHHAALREWRKNANQVQLFVEAETRPLRVDEPISSGSSAASVYANYRRWSETNGHRPMASNKFGERMTDLGFRAQHTKTGNVYPVVFCTAADRSRGEAGEGRVKDYSSPSSNGFYNA